MRAVAACSVSTHMQDERDWVLSLQGAHKGASNTCACTLEAARPTCQPAVAVAVAVRGDAGAAAAAPAAAEL